ncbi:hypothetical protein PYCC9005_000167 [Savitreella phatthalungensis]
MEQTTTPALSKLAILSLCALATATLHQKQNNRYYSSGNTAMAGSDFIVTFKDSATQQEYDDSKKKIQDAGGSIKTEYTLIKGYAASFPDEHVSTLEAIAGVESVEPDGVVTTQ